MAKKKIQFMITKAWKQQRGQQRKLDQHVGGSVRDKRTKTALSMAHVLSVRTSIPGPEMLTMPPEFSTHWSPKPMWVQSAVAMKRRK